MLPINQLIATVLCDFGGFCVGFGLGWISPTIPQFLSDEKPIGEVTLEQTAWLAAMFSLASFIATPFMTFISEHYGRKKCAIFSAGVFAINHLLVIVGKNITIQLIARCFQGIGATGAMLNVPLYVAEIAEPEVRGTLASLLLVFYTLGITSSYIVGGYLSYWAAGWVGLVASLINVVSFIYTPETPMHYIKGGNVEEAIKSLAWLKKKDPNDMEVIKEIERLKALPSPISPLKFQAFKLLVTSKPLRNGFLTCLAMIVIQGMTGMLAVHSYSVTIFMEGGADKLGPNGAASVYGSIQIFGALSSTWLIERLGRKTLMAISCSGVSVCMIVMAVYFHFKSSFPNIEWLPVVALSLCVYIYTIGAAGVPFIMISDVLANEVRGLATMLSIMVLSFNGFFVLRFFAPIAKDYGIHALFYFFGVSTFVCSIFIVLFMTETKGKTNDEIIDMNYRFKGKMKITD